MLPGRSVFYCFFFGRRMRTTRMNEPSRYPAAPSRSSPAQVSSAFGWNAQSRPSPAAATAAAQISARVSCKTSLPHRLKKLRIA